MKITWVTFLVLIAFILGGAQGVRGQEKDAFLESLADLRNPFIPYGMKKKDRSLIVPVVKKDPVQPLVVVPPKPKVQPVPSPVNPAVPVDLRPKVAPVQNIVMPKDFKINGLIWNTDLPQAIVDDKVVRVGDEINGSKIVSIQKNGIEILNSGLKYMVSVSGHVSAASQAKP